MCCFATVKILKKLTGSQIAPAFLSSISGNLPSPSVTFIFPRTWSRAKRLQKILKGLQGVGLEDNLGFSNAVSVSFSKLGLPCSLPQV